MVLQSVFNLVTGKARHAIPLIHRMARAICAIGCVLAAPHAAAAPGGIYVAGPDSGLEKAFTQALADNPVKSSSTFWVVVAGKEIAKTTKSGASADVVRWVNTAHARGGHVYVCRTDMMNAGFKEGDLLDGVISMYGYDAKDWAGLLPARKEGIVLPDNMRQSQQILSACGVAPKP